MEPPQIHELRRILAQREQQLTELVSGLQDYQQDLLLDPSPLVAVLGDRRNGKSWTFATALYYYALETPGVNCVYLAKTRHTTQQTMLGPMRSLKDKFKIKCEYIYERNMIQLANGSNIYFRGADANAQEIEKVLGSKNKITILDEAGHYNRLNTYDAVYSKLYPSIADSEGRVIIGGTCSNIHYGLFFDITNNATTCTKKPITGWSQHTWDWQQNKVAYAALKKMHDKLLADNPDFRDTTAYKRDWTHDWCIEDGAIVFKYDKSPNSKNRIGALPLPYSAYTFILCVDLGYTADSAFVVLAWSAHDPTLYVVEVKKFAGFTTSDIFNYAKKLDTIYHFQTFIIDDGGGGKMDVEDMKDRSNGIPWTSAQKSGKRSAIEMMNSDLQMGRIKCLPEAEPLWKEWEKLIWDEKLKEQGKYEYDKRFPDHASDAALYGFRAAYNFYAQPETVKPPSQRSQEWEDQRIAQEIERNTQAKYGRQNWGGKVDAFATNPSYKRRPW